MGDHLDIKYVERFDSRHNGPSESEIESMLNLMGLESMDQLIDQTIPANIRLKNQLDLPRAKGEHQFLRDFGSTARQNRPFTSLIGMGYYNTLVPSVILRNVLENPGWYTAYTPYQAEIAQGRLEALINFQTMVMDLTGMEIANASLLDEGTAAAEAMSMLYSTKKGTKKDARRFFVDKKIFPQTRDILETRANPLGISLVHGDISDLDVEDDKLFGLIVQNPDETGSVCDFTHQFESAGQKGIKCVVIADILSLVLAKSPGEMGADVVVGSTQRFGVPMGFGGPHAAYFATREAFKRQIPGRIIGASVDVKGNPAYRMALQTREQHIRREKATSNICTAQVLLAVIAGMYAVYHGPEGLRKIARRTHGLAKALANDLVKMGVSIENEHFFDTLKLRLTESESQKVKAIAEAREVNFRYFEGGAIGISMDEACDTQTVGIVIKIFADALERSPGGSSDNGQAAESFSIDWPVELIRTSPFLTHPAFNTYHSEHEMLRYIKHLENKDLSLVHSMISLGSCTMKLNGTSEMIPVTWPEIGGIHPFVPHQQTAGYQKLFQDLESWLSTITGFAATSLQPNSGAQGEFAGLMVIREYHRSRNEGHRNITLIPSSAHGTNPASAVMAGTKVVIVACDEMGNIDLSDLTSKATLHSHDLAALMVTYPSTHGVFEEGIRDVCDIIHENGGLVYMDGANMNAQVGLTSPAAIGADVCHLNLHKTFCIPHGGGGPGVGPICVAQHLAPFLPGNPVVQTGGNQAITAISSAPWGSASILSISYAYIAMMGVKGLKRATELAILNANYIKERLRDQYKILYTGSNGRCAHEMILDCREFKAVDIEVEDIAKRLMDYGFHAPTVSFPVPGTLMVEPTESETKGELDRFCDALLQIREEIREVEQGLAPIENNVLKNAPHTLGVVTSDEWQLPYSREKAAFPLSFVKERKFWPSVSRIDSAYGDRHLVCSCLPIEQYAEESA